MGLPLTEQHFPPHPLPGGLSERYLVWTITLGPKGVFYNPRGGAQPPRGGLKQEGGGSNKNHHLLTMRGHGLIRAQSRGASKRTSVFVRSTKRCTPTQVFPPLLIAALFCGGGGTHVTHDSIYFRPPMGAGGRLPLTHKYRGGDNPSRQGWGQKTPTPTPPRGGATKRGHPTKCVGGHARTHLCVQQPPAAV